MKKIAISRVINNNAMVGLTNIIEQARGNYEVKKGIRTMQDMAVVISERWDTQSSFNNPKCLCNTTESYQYDYACGYVN